MDRIIVAVLLSIVASSLFSDDVHRVVKGDTLFGLSRKYDVPLDLLMGLNGISDPSALKVGSALKLPNTYVVKPGDTYYSIARSRDISVEDLLAANRRSEEDILKVGDRLVYFGGRSGEIDQPEGRATGETTVTSGNRDRSGGGATTGSYADSALSAKETASPYWPHPGDREPMTGKLRGTMFSGEEGDVVLSVSSGKVVWVAPYRGYNKLVIVEAPDRHIFTYGGINTPQVEPGGWVTPGMIIGDLGINPHYESAKAFFFVYRDGKPVDPSRGPRS